MILTRRELQIWGMSRNGLSQAEIGRKLRITRQSICNAMRKVNNKLSVALKEAAESGKIEIYHIDSAKGILLGYSPEAKNKVIMTFSAKHGIQTWHHYNGQCEGCNLYKTCKEIIMDDAKELGIDLSDREKTYPPAKIAQIVFSRVMPGVEP